MRKVTNLLFMFLCIALIGGCAQKKIATTTEMGQKQDITDRDLASRQGEKTGIPSDQSATAALPKETITEREIAKVEPAELRPSARELQTRIKDIYFDFDSYDLNDSAKETLKELASLLLKNRGIKVIIEGHCDERGTNEYNLTLGDRRAASAKEYLISLGIPRARIETISYGEEKPVCTEENEECWKKNRRAHFVLIEDTK